MVAEEIVRNIEEQKRRSLIFTYGTLKTGFSNHTLIQDLIRTGDAVFMGTCTTGDRYPLVCGPYRVPFLINEPGSGHQVTGEVYAVSGRGLTRMDELEGTTKGHYERLPITLLVVGKKVKKVKREEEPEGEKEDGFSESGSGSDSDMDMDVKVTMAAEAYFAHRSYAMEMWKKEEAKREYYKEYTEKVAKGYVKRKDRPQHLTFLDHIRLFLSSDSH